MAVTAETRTSLIGLSVVMLGSAPGTDLLNEWVDAINDGMSLEDIANHIAGSDDFTSTYPTFLTNEEFASSFLENLMGDEEVPAALVAAAVGIVTGLLNDGMTRGALALAVVGAMYDIHAQGEDHPAYADLGMVAMAFANKIDVAEYYTVDLRQAGPNSRVLRDVNSENGLDEVRDSISDHLDPADPIYLTNVRDDIEGTVANDRIVAEPDKNGNDTLDPFDVIDGDAGYDTLEVYTSDADVDPGIDIDANHAQVSNVERAYLSSRTGINADLAGWEGLEEVELGRFGATHDVTVKVDGASVSTSRTFGGDVTIVGSAGEVTVDAGKTSTVNVGSGAHTTSVTVNGGAIVNVNASGAGGQSMTVTSVVLNGVTGEGLGGDGARGNPMEEVGVTIPDGNVSATASATVTVYVDSAGDAIDEAGADFMQNYYRAANQAPDGVTIDEFEVVVTTDAEMAATREQVFVDGKRVDPGTEDAMSGVDSGGVPIHVNSDAIEHVSLSNTYATIAVINKSDDPEDLMITVDEYGDGDVAGKFCVTGDGSAENISIMVAGDSHFYLASNEVKAVSVAGEGDLELEVTNFVAPPTNVDAGGANEAMASGTLESITLSGSGDVSMDVAGMGKLATIDASASSGGNSIKGIGDSVTSIDGGSGGDKITVAAFAEDGLTVDLGAGNDYFASAGGHTKSRVDGGEGVDVLHLTGTSATHKVDGKDVSIFSNFEALEIGGTAAAAAHDISLLGVHAVSVSASTAAVTLNKMADGMGLTVNGRAGMGTTATVVHNMAPRSAGDPRYSGELDVSLTANGHKDDTAMGAGTGTASLTLTADGEIEILNIESNANPKGKAAAGNYQNSLTLMGAGGDTAADAVDVNVEAINVSGSARAMVSLVTGQSGTLAAQFAELELIDAEDNSGGVTFSANGFDGDGTTAAVLNQDLEMVGGSGKDSFTGGGGEDELMGNGGNDTLNGGAEDDTIDGGAGGDMLTGGDGDDTFKYGSASESRVVFGEKGMSGFDTITDWGTADTNNVIALGKTLYESLGGTVRTHTAINGTDNDDADGAQGDEADGTLDNLKAFLDSFKDGDGVFESRGTPVDGAINDQGPLNKHSVATVEETYWMTRPVANDPDTTEDETVAGVSASRTWLLIDVDGDGDFNAATDMAIALTGTGLTIDADSFEA